MKIALATLALVGGSLFAASTASAQTIIYSSGGYVSPGYLAPPPVYVPQPAYVPLPYPPPVYAPRPSFSVNFGFGSLGYPYPGYGSYYRPGFVYPPPHHHHH